MHVSCQFLTCAHARFQVHYIISLKWIYIVKYYAIVSAENFHPHAMYTFRTVCMDSLQQSKTASLPLSPRLA